MLSAAEREADGKGLDEVPRSRRPDEHPEESAPVEDASDHIGLRREGRGGRAVC